MKPSLFLILFVSFSTISISQENEVEPKDSVVGFDEGSYAEFPGGSQAMSQYIAENVVYPEEAMENGESGNVYISFTVDSTGLVKDIKIDRGVSESIDKECIRLVESMPRWKPATTKGKKVASRQRFPIRFKLANVE